MQAENADEKCRVEECHAGVSTEVQRPRADLIYRQPSTRGHHDATMSSLQSVDGLDAKNGAIRQLPSHAAIGTLIDDRPLACLRFRIDHPGGVLRRVLLFEVRSAFFACRAIDAHARAAAGDAPRTRLLPSAILALHASRPGQCRSRHRHVFKHHCCISTLLFLLSAAHTTESTPPARNAAHGGPGRTAGPRRPFRATTGTVHPTDRKCVLTDQSPVSTRREHPFLC